MRITEQMIDVVFDAFDPRSRPGQDPTPGEVESALIGVAPLMAEAAVSGFIEQGHQLRRAVSLLRSVVDPHRSHTVFPEIDAFLSQVDL